MLIDGAVRCATQYDAHRFWQMKMADEVKAPLKALRVLIVEDNALIGMLYADLLGEMGHTVCAIEATETEAIAAATMYKPDLMIVDAGLGQGTGMSAVKTILGAGFIPHLFVSGDVTSVRAVMPGAIILRKPFLEPDLGRAIQQALAAASNR